MFSLGLVISLWIWLCSITRSSVNRGDNSRTEALARTFMIRAFPRTKVLEKDSDCVMVVWWDVLVTACADRASKTAKSWNNARNECQISRRRTGRILSCAQEPLPTVHPSVWLWARGSFLPELQTPACLTLSHSSWAQISHTQALK